jgi:hypothetical protein
MRGQVGAHLDSVGPGPGIYGPFIEQGIPAGSLFTGAEGIKTAQEKSVFGGVAGQPYDRATTRAATRC